MVFSVLVQFFPIKYRQNVEEDVSLNYTREDEAWKSHLMWFAFRKQIFLVQQFSIKEQDKKQQKVSADSSSLIQGLLRLLMIFFDV